MATVSNSVIVLNVGGKLFSTSTRTLSQIPNSYFSRLISGQVQNLLKDSNGNIFIDRDPVLFKVILNFLRSGDVDLREVTVTSLKQEAMFYGISPLVTQLSACQELRQASCGSLLFCTRLKPLIVINKQHQGGNHGNGERKRPQQLRLYSEQDKVTKIVGHHDCVAVAYSHCICVLKLRECHGWQLLFVTPSLDKPPELVVLNGNVNGGSSSYLGNEVLAASHGSIVTVWSCSPQPKLLTFYDLNVNVTGLSFANNQLVAISNTGSIAIWQSVQKHWQKQVLPPIGCYIVDGSFLFLGCEKGSIDCIDTEKFPVRLKDNDLLVNQVYDDPHNEAITAIDIYKPCKCDSHDQSCIEIVYGTKGGRVKIVRYPQNLKHSSRLFQSYHVHAKPVSMVTLGEKYIVSVCKDNHVRTWSINRVDDHITSTNEIISLSSFRILSLDGANTFTYPNNPIGPFGGRDDEFSVFVQRVIPGIDTIYIRQSSTGDRVCKISSVDQSTISAYYVQNGYSSQRNKETTTPRFIFTGHGNGSLQVWDLNAAFERHKDSSDKHVEGLSEQELLDIFKTYKTNPSSITGGNTAIDLHSFCKAPQTPCPVLLGALCPDCDQLPKRHSPSEEVPTYCRDTPIFTGPESVFSFPTVITRSLTTPKRYHRMRRVNRPKSVSDVIDSTEDYDVMKPYPLRRADSDGIIVDPVTNYDC